MSGGLRTGSVSTPSEHQSGWSRGRSRCHQKQLQVEGPVCVQEDRAAGADWQLGEREQMMSKRPSEADSCRAPQVIVEPLCFIWARWEAARSEPGSDIIWLVSRGSLWLVSREWTLNRLPSRPLAEEPGRPARMMTVHGRWLSFSNIRREKQNRWVLFCVLPWTKLEVTEKYVSFHNKNFLAIRAARMLLQKKKEKKKFTVTIWGKAGGCWSGILVKHLNSEEVWLHSM